MKRIILFAFILMAFLLSVKDLFAAERYAAEAKKTITKSCAVQNPKIQLVHKYGNATLVVWDRNEISMTASIKTRARTQKIADDILKFITVDFNPNTVNGTQILTQIDHDQINPLTKNADYQINITINLPLSMFLDLTCKYGNVTALNGTTKDVEAMVKYGNLSIGDIGGKATVEVKYGNTKIGKIKGDLQATVGYGNISCGGAAKTTLGCKYGNATFGKLTSINSTVGYGNISISEVGAAIFSEIGYGRCTIGLLHNSLSISELKYGGLTATVAQTFNSINVDAKYSNVDVVLTGNPSFEVDLYTKYGSIDVDGFKVNKVQGSSDDSNEQEVIGTVGAATSKRIKIANKYANITIRKN